MSGRPPAPPRRWRAAARAAAGLPGRARELWRHSLRVRTLAVTIAASSLAIIVACVWMALAIRNDLFQSRLNEALDDARRAAVAAQETLDSSAGADAAQTRAIMTSVSTQLSRQSASERIAVFRIDTAPAPNAPLDFTVGGDWYTRISDPLRQKVQNDPDLQWWQSVPLASAAEPPVPGIVVGQQLSVPGAGPYELYIGYDLGAAVQTLGFVQGTLWVVGISLVLIIAGIGWVVLRSVTVPVVEAARTSAALASGHLDVRLAVHGADELAVLAESFNAMADSIQSQIRELADLSLVQQRFVADVSHELRTPLTTIRLAADVLHDARDRFDPATARAAELLHAQVQRFETLLSDLLEISRYDAGSLELEREPTSLAALAGDVVDSMRDLAADAGCEVVLVAPGGHAPVDMDPRRIRRILRNLIGNAIEHGDGRPITVTVDGDDDAVALGVRDRGHGMTPAEVERVFDRFWRADPARRRSIGGTGLGMSIALGDARLHGGTISVWSAPGRGTNVVLTLPRRPGAPPSSPLPREPDDAVATGTARP